MKMSRKEDIRLLLLLLWAGGVRSIVSGPNVCNQESLVPSTALHSLPDLKTNCERLGLSGPACEAARSNQLSFSDLYILKSSNVCCDGWIQNGEACSPCASGTYGQNCSIACRCFNGGGGCHHVTGECSCDNGWTGERCEKRCSAGEYGPNCTRPCQSVCENGGVCHPSSGHCLCDYMWKGDTCVSQCDWHNCNTQSDSCSNGATYDPVGFCLCAPGWKGRYCTEPCGNNTFGAHCTENCQCMNDGLCNWEDGSCLCPPGYAGTFCENRCEAGSYGQDCALGCDCPLGGSCDHVHGACLECPLGFFGNRCTVSCSVGHWGNSCNRSCDCIGRSPCDRFTGRCTHDLTSSTSEPWAITSTALPSHPSKFLDFPEETDGRSDGFDPTGASFIAPFTICFLLVLVVFVVVAVLVHKNQCRTKANVGAADLGPHTFTHQYIDCTADTGGGEYAEIVDINCGYEVPLTVALDKPQNSKTQQQKQPKPRGVQPDVNYYIAPPGYAPSIVCSTSNSVATGDEEIKVDACGYLDLTSGRQAPPEYQSIVAPRNI